MHTKTARMTPGIYTSILNNKSEIIQYIQQRLNPTADQRNETFTQVGATCQKGGENNTQDIIVA